MVFQHLAEIPGPPRTLNDPHFISTAATHVGKVRESNQDAFVRRDDAGLWAVADGMGGHEAGDVASHTIARLLQGVTATHDLEELLSGVRAAIDKANSELRAMRDDLGGRPPGSTVAVLLISGAEGTVAWAGDSRIYRLRAGKVEQITHDHSHVQELVDDGLIQPQDSESHPLAHVITRAVGIDEALVLETRQLEVLSGDQYLLCTDGLSRLLAPEEIASYLSLAPDQEAGVEDLISEALKRGAPDNVTAVCVGVG
jgi:serine/threonine-protein phosphatase Stp1